VDFNGDLSLENSDLPDSDENETTVPSVELEVMLLVSRTLCDYPGLVWVGKGGADRVRTQ
jgi:hypothetical protein